MRNCLVKVAAILALSCLVLPGTARSDSTAVSLDDDKALGDPNSPFYSPGTVE